MKLVVNSNSIVHYVDKPSETVKNNPITFESDSDVVTAEIFTGVIAGFLKQVNIPCSLNNLTTNENNEIMYNDYISVLSNNVIDMIMTVDVDGERIDRDEMDSFIESKLKYGSYDGVTDV